MIRDVVRTFAELGPLPDSSAPVDEVEKFEQALLKIPRPVSSEEARTLLRSFGPDDCFGLAWTLLHLIETAPEYPVTSDPGPDSNEWLRELWGRYQRGLALGIIRSDGTRVR